VYDASADATERSQARASTGPDHNQRDVLGLGALDNHCVCVARLDLHYIVAANNSLQRLCLSLDRAGSRLGLTSQRVQHHNIAIMADRQATRDLHEALGAIRAVAGNQDSSSESPTIVRAAREQHRDGALT
jgi:hypothetical protein